jgi:hypothetical protein
VLFISPCQELGATELATAGSGLELNAYPCPAPQVEKDKAYIKSEAVLRIAQQLNMPLALLAGLAFLVPKPAADVLYDQVGLRPALNFIGPCGMIGLGTAQDREAHH